MDWETEELDLDLIKSQKKKALEQLEAHKEKEEVEYIKQAIEKKKFEEKHPIWRTLKAIANGFKMMGKGIKEGLDRMEENDKKKKGGSGLAINPKYLDGDNTTGINPDYFK